MASITYWNRLEPRPRSDEIGRSLAACVRDPLWMLTRQWQFGEFHGEDAASPAWVTIEATLTPFLGWRPEGGTIAPLSGKVPLEELVETEAFTPDLSIRVELGQIFEIFLTEEGVPELVVDFRNATSYQIAPVSEDNLANSPDRDAVRFQNVVAQRAIDGVAVYEAAIASLPGLPAEPVIDPGKQLAARTALEKLRDWVQGLYGELGKSDPPTWVPERLEYRVDTIAAMPSGDVSVFSADPDRNAEFDWYIFDLEASAKVNIKRPADVAINVKKSIIPTHVRFRGMPNARWWDFENAVLDFGAIIADRRDVAKLVVIDFMLVHGNDWFVLPLEQPVNSLARIDVLTVKDVFGGITYVPRAESFGAVPGERWTMFTNTVHGGSAPVSDVLILPPSAATVLQCGEAIEDVRFIRDEMANMAWAIEHATEGGIGQPLLGFERDVAQKARTPESPGTVPADAPPLRYQIQTTVPENWIPFLPVVPVVINPVRGDVALERAAMLRTPSEGPPTPVLPIGRILNPGSIGTDPYRVREEEITRAGVKVSRIVCRSRWIDGSTHLWIARRKGAGKGEGSSGLQFDLAMPNR